LRTRPWLARQDWYLALGLALFVGVGVWFARAIEDFFAPAETSIVAPALVGESLDDALATADRTHVKAVAVSQAPSDRFPKDVVMRQDPAPGTQVREGRQISLVVSSGVEIIVMPDLRYESQREVSLDLSHDKLLLGKVRMVASDDVPAGYVVAQDPPPLTPVRVGTLVNVALAKGGPQAVRVPDFLALPIDAARQAAADAHIRIGQVVWTPFGRYGPARGVVVAQRPAFNTVIDPQSEVSLQVSAGPREAGYLIRQVHAIAEVPADAADDPSGKAPAVRVQVRDETGTWDVYNAYAQPKQKLDFNLTVVGTSQLDIYVNDELVGSTQLGVEPKIQESQQAPNAPATGKESKNP
jgi:serine/threonine-protein kinase